MGTVGVLTSPSSWTCDWVPASYPVPGAFMPTPGLQLPSTTTAIGAAKLNDDDVDDLVITVKGLGDDPDALCFQPDAVRILTTRVEPAICTLGESEVPPPTSTCGAWEETDCSPSHQICDIDQSILYPKTGQLPTALDTGDVNNDGITDIVVANRTTHDVTLIHGAWDPSGEYVMDGMENPVKLISLGDEPLDIALGDVDGDGFLDMVTVLKTKVAISWSADGTNFKTPMFIEQTPGGKKLQPHMVKVADFNKDGREDILVLSQATDRILLYISLGDRSLAGPYEFASASKPVDLHLADINQDGCTDVLVANKDSKSVSLLVNEFCGW